MTKDKQQEPAKKSRADQAVDWLMGQIEARHTKLENLLHPDMPLVRFLESCRVAFARNPELADTAKTDPGSLVAAIMLGARSGLDVHGHNGHLVSFNKTKSQNGEPSRKVIQFFPDFKGLIAVWKSVGAILDAEPVLVYASDDFRPVEGVERNIHHVPFIRRNASDKKGDIIAAYTRFLLPNERWVVKGMLLLEDIERVEAGIRAENGPWNTPHRSEMVKKTSIKNAGKTLGPSTSDKIAAMRLAALDEALAAENEAIEGSWSPADAPTRGVAGAKQAVQRALAAPGPRTELEFTQEPERVPVAAGEMSEQEKREAIAAEFEAGRNG